MTTAERRERVAQLRDEGWSFDRIGAELRCAKRTALLDAQALGLSTAPVAKCTARAVIDVEAREPSAPDRRAVEQLRIALAGQRQLGVRFDEAWASASAASNSTPHGVEP